MPRRSPHNQPYYEIVVTSIPQWGFKNQKHRNNLPLAVGLGVLNPI